MKKQIKKILTISQTKLRIFCHIMTAILLAFTITAPNRTAVVSIASVMAVFAIIPIVRVVYDSDFQKLIDKL